MAPRTVAITGARGFIGTKLTELLTARGDEVRGIDVRPGPGIVVGDVSRPGPWTDALVGADVVIHAAALVGERGDVATVRRVNVHATRQVLQAAAAAGVGRVVHISSKVVLGSHFPDGVDESWPVTPTGNPYTDTKISAEHLALRAHAAGDVPVTVIRPGDVYGPGSAEWTVRAVELLRAGWFRLFDEGRGILTPVFIDDIADGILTVGTHPDAAGQVFFVTGGVGVSAREFFGHYAAMLDVPMRSLPRTATAALTPLMDAWRLLGQEPPFSRRTIEYVTHPGTYSIDAARRVAGWEPQVDLDEGMARTQRWLREAGLLDGPLP